MSETESPVVLVVDDEPDVADAYAAHAAEDYEVRTAYGGEQALSELDDSVDVVLLDRRMPGVSGDDVLDAIRDRGLDCHIAMVTAIDPDFDIIDMPFDDYVVKPVTRDELLDTVGRLLRCREYEQRLQRYYAVSRKIAALSDAKSEVELERSDEFADLKRRRDRLRNRLDDAVERFEHEDFQAVFRELQKQRTAE